MVPIRFPEVNVTLSKPDLMSDEECKSLPVFRDGERCISCWKLTWKEKLSVVFYGKVWLSVFGGSTQPPVWLLGSKTAFVKLGKG